MSNGGITTNLSIGDKLYALSDTASNYIPETLEEIRAFCLGFTLGDGCDYSNSDLGMQVRLCQHKTEYLEYFIKAGFNYYQVQNSEDIVVYNKSEYQKQTFLNSSGWRLMSLEQKIALFNGYYSADGRVNSHSISTVDERLMNMIILRNS